jgi:hypothetical protein
MAPITRPLRSFVKRMRAWWQQPLMESQSAVLQATQVELIQRYRQLAREGRYLPTINEAGFRVFSDTDEDGILLYLFALVGSPTRRLVDLGAASHTASNTANLILNHGWTGLLVDGAPDSVDAGRAFFAGHPMTRAWPPRIECAFVTAENVNDVLCRNEIVGDIDLLSIDIDGMDFWIWKAIDVVTPRVVVVEYQDIAGWDRAVTVPYSPTFRVTDYPVNRESNDYAGASLPAMVTLGREKGYRLVGANRLGYNAFFVHEGLASRELPEVDARTCLSHPWNRYGMRVRWPRVADMEWIEVQSGSL